MCRFTYTGESRICDQRLTFSDLGTGTLPEHLKVASVLHALWWCRGLPQEGQQLPLMVQACRALRLLLGLCCESRTFCLVESSLCNFGLMHGLLSPSQLTTWRCGGAVLALIPQKGWQLAADFQRFVNNDRRYSRRHVSWNSSSVLGMFLQSWVVIRVDLTLSLVFLWSGDLSDENNGRWPEQLQMLLQ